MLNITFALNVQTLDLLLSRDGLNNILAINDLLLHFMESSIALASVFSFLFLFRYLVCGQSSNALMVAALRDMVNQRANDIRITGFEGALDYITIPLDVAQHKAEQIKVNWSGFLSSKEFTKSSFILDESGGGALKVSWMSTGL